MMRELVAERRLGLAREQQHGQERQRLVDLEVLHRVLSWVHDNLCQPCTLYQHNRHDRLSRFRWLDWYRSRLVRRLRLC